MRFRRILCLAVVLSGSLSAQRMAGTFSSLQAFLDVCPQNDPYYAVFRKDFQILRDQVAVGAIACTEPYTKLPASQVTEELTILQAIRFAYYMDMGRSGYLPWTSLRLYDWWKSRVAGFNVDTALNPGAVAASCCVTINGGKFIFLSRISDDGNRLYRLTANGLASQVATYSHEVRHSEGNGYPHVSCCGIPNGCDQTYDETNLSAYGIQYYLAKLWTNGDINLGYSCNAADRTNLGSLFAQLANVYPSRFCDVKPAVIPVPTTTAGGACIAPCTLTLGAGAVASTGSLGGALSAPVTNTGPACGWTTASTADWITVTAGANSSGNGNATVAVSQNLTVPRSGTVVAAGSKLAVNEAAASSCPQTCSASAAISSAAGAPVAFAGGAQPASCSPFRFDWDFGDGSPHASDQNPSHSYNAGGNYSWTMMAAGAAYSCLQSGAIQVATGPVVADGGVLNAASFAKDANGHGSAVAPGSLVTIFGAFPGATAANAGAPPLPDSLGSVSVTFNGLPARLENVVQAGQYPAVSAQMPFSVPPGQANVVVKVNGVSSSPKPIPVTAAAPGVFTIPPDGQHNAIFIFVDPDDGRVKIAAPVGASIGYPTAPAPRGQVGFFYATGLGALTPPVPDGDADLAVTHFAVDTPSVLVGGIAARLDFAGQAPGFPGVNQINIAIPTNAPTGDAVALQVRTADGKIVSSPGATIAIR